MQDQIDMIDPELTADLTRVFYDTQKTDQAIARLERKCEEESQGYE